MIVGPDSGGAGKCLGHALKAKAVAKSRVALKENPAFNWVKMQAKKSPVLPKTKKSVGKGTERNLPEVKGGTTELQQQGLA